MKLEAFRPALQVSIEFQRLLVFRRELDFKTLIEQSPGLGVELDAEDVAKTLMLDRLDDFPVERRGDRPEAFSQLFNLLMVGGENGGMDAAASSRSLSETALPARIGYRGRKTPRILPAGRGVNRG